MLNTPLLSHDLVLVGGGHSHAIFLRKWGMKPLPGVRVTLINPGPTAAYSGMLPGHVAGHYTREALDIDLVRLCRFAGARLILAPATAIDTGRKHICVKSRGEIGYDVASLDIGVHSRMSGIEGFDAHAVPVKPLGAFATRWQAFLADVSAGTRRPQVAVIGAGVAGVELAMAAMHALRQIPKTSPKVTLIEGRSTILPSQPAPRSRLKRALDDNGIALHLNALIDRIDGDGVLLADGQRIASQFILGAGGAAAHRWLADSGLPTTEDGFVHTGPDLRVRDTDSLFAVGDCAHLDHAPRGKAGVYAVRAAPVLFHNIRAKLQGGPLRPFHPQREYLKLVSLGDKSALAEKWGMTLAGPHLWRWKNHIDQTFMEKFRDLPEMREAVPMPGARAQTNEINQPLCGGCGSKVGAKTLATALAQLPQGTRSDVLSTPGDDAAILQIDGTRQVLTTDHLRAFTEDHGLLARIATLHALGDIWAMGATPQAALLSITLPRMTPALQERSLTEITAAASNVLAQTGAEIVGGHTTMGAELTIGLTLTGLASKQPITIAGAQPDDVLVLTRPIGSGVLLAAEMQGKASGNDIATMFDRMCQPQDDAAAILSDANAMTDVTGFGLAGHLLNICHASGLGAELELETIPIYAGALDLVGQGVRSTIWQDNREATPVQGASGRRGDLLHDPQTAGGLLAAIRPGQGADVIARLRTAGHDAQVIGRMVDGSPAIRCC
ncbi:selenide, water dikinase SelD [Qingshengfaniella alkalisoli]|uniref:Selenide, water dikinase SelD n=1 Tax=Qingshengfaniella alkalisoli TaxID=2599296 RepID=A0A5B8J932_9RHOB|nr:selenide, water dikinase SelD [Qingshengfaniella alkalisoli]QDY70857.1 selenide, water dikinase SelD [Qingshengfaniella alkalisoli]